MKMHEIDDFFECCMMHYFSLSKNKSVIGLVIRSRAFGTRSYHSANNYSKCDVSPDTQKLQSWSSKILKRGRELKVFRIETGKFFLFQSENGFFA